MEASSIEALLGIPEWASPAELQRASALYGGNVCERRNLCDGRRTNAVTGASLSAGVPHFPARDRLHAPDYYWLAANKHPRRLWLPVECAARCHTAIADLGSAASYCH